MSYGTSDVYYNPEELGLTVIGELDDPNASYSFDMLVVWKHEDGRLFWATDSGCSCPSPFENYTSLDDLTELTSGNWSQFEEAVRDHCANWDYEFVPTGIQMPAANGWTYDGTLTRSFRSEQPQDRWKRRHSEDGAFAADKVELLAKVHKALVA